MTELLNKARRAGADPQRVAETLANALGKYDNFKLVEMEVQKVIASSREKPALKSGEGVVVSSPGVTSGSILQEGGTPQKRCSSREKAPTGGGSETILPREKPLQKGSHRLISLHQEATKSPLEVVEPIARHHTLVFSSQSFKYGAFYSVSCSSAVDNNICKAEIAMRLIIFSLYLGAEPPIGSNIETP